MADSNSFRSTGRRFAGLVLSFIMILCSLALTSCHRDDGDFPDIGSPDSGEGTYSSEGSEKPDSESEMTAEDSSGNYRSITVALPYSQSTVNYLSELYYVKNNDLMTEGDNGGNISLEYLDSIQTPWFINSIQTSMSGVDTTTLAEWSESGFMPDIYLAEDIRSMVDGGYALPLQELLADSELIGNSNLFSKVMDTMTLDGTIYGIPHYSTAVILAINLDYLPDSGVLDYIYTPEDLRTFLQAMSDKALEAENTSEANTAGELVPFAEAYDLIPYIAPSISGRNYSYMLFDEYHNGNTSVATTAVGSIVRYCDELYDLGLSSDTDSAGNDPVADRVAGMWMLSSSQIDDFNSYYPGRVYYLPLPSYDHETASSPMLTVYPLCLASGCENADFAADFAAFISLDPDAQLLIRRLEPKNGYYPLIRNAAVWLDLADETDNGRIASFYEMSMDTAVYCPGNNGNGLYSAVNSYISDYSLRRSDEGETAVFNLQECYGGY